ncbi:hypothetical protein HNO89_002116 [Sporosarcina luteola]|nr:hypothetical protein [Sporosarcina luteola]
MKQQSRTPFLKRPWVASIGVFLLAQLVFSTFETTGWMPIYKDIDGTVFERIVESSFFRTWFTFYEKPHFNLLTVFFGVFFLVPGVIGGVRSIFIAKT